MATTLSSTKSSAKLPCDVRSSVLSRTHRGWYFKGLRTITLIVLDLVALSLAWVMAETLGTSWSSLWRFQVNPMVLPLILAVGMGVLLAGGFYKAGDLRRNYVGLVKANTLAVLLLLLSSYLYQPNQFVSRSQFLLYWIFSVVLILAERFLLNYVIFKARLNGAICYPVFLITDASDVEHVTQLVSREHRYKIVGVSDPASLDELNRMETFAKIRQLGVAEVFVSGDAIKDRQFLCWQFQAAGICVHIVSVGLDDLFSGSKFWKMAENFPAIIFSPPTITGSDFWLKRVFDFCASLVLLALLAPIYAVIALLIRLDSAGPVFYRQVRVGLHGKLFYAWKFRTMVTNADRLQAELEAQNQSQDGILFKMKADPRITRVGGWLRQYSLDELPQLFNVLLGEMSLVGPRPLPVRDVERFAAHHYVRHEVLPGITGLWQVSGRSDITDFEDVIQLDLDYIQNWSLGLDMDILLRTVNVVLRKTGAY
jgi:exopolysaccharide biosynthesis polyprenyl glycosylphosphotransferase